MNLIQNYLEDGRHYPSTPLEHLPLASYAISLEVEKEVNHDDHSSGGRFDLSFSSGLC